MYKSLNLFFFMFLTQVQYTFIITSVIFVVRKESPDDYFSLLIIYLVMKNCNQNIQQLMG